MGKCSHGGILDKTTVVPASGIVKSKTCNYLSFKNKDNFFQFQGGINKDSSFYLFSPHANLHFQAARLAIAHTEYFFNQIRNKIGDEEFSNFLQLKLTKERLNSNQVCAGIELKAFVYLIYFLLMIYFFYTLIF